MADEKVFFGKKEGKQLYSTYGEADLYNSGQFKPFTRNLTTNALLSKSHHCERCASYMSNSCYDFPHPHYAFCSTWVTRNDRRERCGERMAIRSTGCFQHPRNHGFNEPLFRAAEGGEVGLSEFDDPESTGIDAQHKQSQKSIERQLEETELADAIESYLTDHDFIPEDFISNYHADRKARDREAEVADGLAALQLASAQPVGKVNDPNLNPSVIAHGNSHANRHGRRATVAARGMKTFKGKKNRGIPEEEVSTKERKTYAPKGTKPKKTMDLPQQRISEKKGETPETQAKNNIRNFMKTLKKSGK